MKSELLHGTLEVIVLKTLSWGPMHGYGIGRWIEQLGTGALRSRKGLCTQTHMGGLCAGGRAGAGGSGAAGDMTRESPR